MPHDKYNKPIKSGDKVSVHFVVEEVWEGAEMCSVRLTSVESMFANDGKATLTCTAKGVIKHFDEDDIPEPGGLMACSPEIYKSMQETSRYVDLKEKVMQALLEADRSDLIDAIKNG